MLSWEWAEWLCWSITVDPPMTNCHVTRCSYRREYIPFAFKPTMSYATKRFFLTYATPPLPTNIRLPFVYPLLSSTVLNGGRSISLSLRVSLRISAWCSDTIFVWRWGSSCKLFSTSVAVNFSNTLYVFLFSFNTLLWCSLDSLYRWNKEFNQRFCFEIENIWKIWIFGYWSC